MENENENDDPIVHCGECKWWERAWENSAHGMCHVNAPAIDGSRWPETNQTRWCGQGSPKGRVAAQLVRVDSQAPERPPAQPPTAKDQAAEYKIEYLTLTRERDEWAQDCRNWRTNAEAAVRERDKALGANKHLLAALKDTATHRDHYLSICRHIGDLFYPASWASAEGVRLSGVICDRVPVLVAELVEKYKAVAGEKEWNKLVGKDPAPRVVIDAVIPSKAEPRAESRPASCLCGGVGCNSCEPQGRG